MRAKRRVHRRARNHSSINKDQKIHLSCRFLNGYGSYAVKNHSSDLNAQFYVELESWHRLVEAEKHNQNFRGFVESADNFRSWIDYNTGFGNP